MTTLTDYLDPETIQHLQEAFSRATGYTVRIFSHTDGLASSAGTGSHRLETPITLNDRPLGGVSLAAPHGQAMADPEAAAAMLNLLGEVLKVICAKQQQLRARIEELATLYRLTGVFTERRSLPEVLDTVVRTFVEVMGVKACGLRLLNTQTGELTVEAVANLSSTYLKKGRILLRDSKLDSEALATGRAVYVEDERTDPRVLFKAEARREGIVSALIVPLIYKAGPVGALRLYTSRRHRFSDWEVALALAIASQAAAAIVNARLYAERLEAEEMRRQMQLASVVQRRMIPADHPRLPGLDIAAVYVPSLELSGDFYDFIDLPHGNLGFVICDVMGKGVPAALLTAAIRGALRAHADDLYDLADIIRRVNGELCTDTQTESFATLFYGVLNTATGRLTYCNAGHEPPLLCRNGRITSLNAGGIVLGITPEARYQKGVIQLRAGDVILCATDGLIDAANFQHEPFGRERTRKALLEAVATCDSADAIVRHVLWHMRRFAGLHDRDDDVTMLAVRLDEADYTPVYDDASETAKST